MNRYTCIELSQRKARLLYVVDLAEIPALQERAAVDTDRNGAISDEEHNRYLSQKSENLSQGLELDINGVSAPLTIVSKELIFPPRQGSLLTQRLTLTLEAALPPISKGENWRIDYRDSNYKDRHGWKKIIVQPDHDIDLLESNVPQQDQSQGLRN